MLEKLKKISKIELSPKYNKLYILAIAFFLPVIIVLLVCKTQNMNPFGDTAWLIVDMYGQYSPYLDYFKSFFDGTANLFFTFNSSLGADVWGLFTYYLASPVNLIFLLFSSVNLTDGIAWLIIIKIGLCGLTFNYFISRKSSSDFKSLLFSTSYALCAYVINYCYNIMWIDGVILLPIIALGIDYIIEKNKYMLYVISLALALFINYYIGFMLCIFSGIYFIYKFFLAVDNKAKLKLYWKKILLFAFASIVAVGLAGVVLLPNFGSIQSGRGEFDFSVLNFNANYSLADTTSKLFTHAFENEQVQNGGLPQIYCGTFALFMAILYFFNKKIPFREKCASAVVLGIFVISFHLQAFNLMWHGLNNPAWFYYRFSFIFCFVLIFLGYRSFQKLSHNAITRNDLLKVVGIITIVAIWIEKQGYSYITPKWLYLDCLLALIYAILISLYMKFRVMSKDMTFSITKRKNIKNNIILIFFIMIYLVSLDLWVNTNYTLEDLKNGSASHYYNDVEKNTAIVNKIKSEDSTLYRMEKTFSRTTNDPLHFRYYGISYSSSTYKDSTNEFLKRLGFNKNHVWVEYNNGSTTAVDSLLGIKYVVIPNDEVMYKNYTLKFEEKDSYIYENPYALSWGYLISDFAYNTSVSSDNTFEVQNSMLKNMTSISKNVYYEAIEPSVKVENIKISKNDDITEYAVIDNNSEAWIEYSINITSTDNIYAHILLSNAKKAEIYINDELHNTSFESFPSEFIDLGKYEIGDTVKLKLILKENILSVTDILVYYEDLEVLEQHYNKLAENQADIVLNSSSSLTATVNVTEDNKTLLLTVPYDTGWSMTVDGVETEPSKIFDALIAVDLPIGEHTVTINYIPEGFNKGLLISLGALLLLLISRVVVIVFRNKNK